MYLLIFNNNNIFYYCQNFILLLLQIFKTAYSYYHVTNYILNDTLFWFMDNKKHEHKNATRGRNDFCSPSLTLGCHLRQNNSTPWPIGKIKILIVNKEPHFFMPTKEFNICFRCLLVHFEY